MRSSFVHVRTVRKVVASSWSEGREINTAFSRRSKFSMSRRRTSTSAASVKRIGLARARNLTIGALAFRRYSIANLFHTGSEYLPRS